MKTGMEMMMEMLMKSMGIKPEEVIAKFQQPIQAGLQGIQDVDARLTRLERMVTEIYTATTGKEVPNYGKAIDIGKCDEYQQCDAERVRLVG